MRSVLTLAAVLLITSVAAADEPATQPDLYALQNALTQAQDASDAAHKAFEDHLSQSPDHIAAQQDVDAKKKALDDARANGSTDDRIAASSAYNKAREALADLEKRALVADTDVANADKALGDARVAFIRAKSVADAANAARADEEQQKKDLENTRLADPVTVGDLTITLGRAVIKKVPLTDNTDGSTGKSKDAYLVIPLTIKNTSDGKKVDYQSWMGDRIGDKHAKLTDDLGNNYRVIDFGIFNKPDGHTEGDAIYPGKSLSDVLVFEVPTDKAKSFDLELPGDNLGLDDPIKVHFDTDKVSRGGGDADQNQ
jgi:Domain of unknown function (DUF4352)